MQIRPWSDPENFNAGYVMRRRTSGSSRATARHGSTCWSTTRNSRSSRGGPPRSYARLHLSPAGRPEALWQLTVMPGWRLLVCVFELSYVQRASFLALPV